MARITLELGSCVILSGPPGAGKSSLTKEFPDGLTISSDSFREQFFGWTDTYHDEGLAICPSALNDKLVFNTLKSVLDTRMRVGLTTFVDTTAITDVERKEFADIAKEYDRPVLVVIFDLPLETLYTQNSERYSSVPKEVVERFYNKLQRDSKYPYIIVNNFNQIDELIKFKIPKIREPNLDVIGDVHGLYDDLRLLLNKLGYDGELNHPNGNKLCFLGDLVDRGPKSLEVLELVVKAIDNGHYCVKGNHERNLERQLKGDKIDSISTRETAHKVLSAGKKDEVLAFIAKLPAFYEYNVCPDDLYVICHGNIEDYNPYTVPLKTFCHGTTKYGDKKDTDTIYIKTSDGERGLIRGHIPYTSKEAELSRAVISLEEGAGFGGPMVALRLINDGTDIFDKEIVRQETSFDYNKRELSFGEKMRPLVKQKLVNEISHGNLTLYKYSQSAFHSGAKIWEEHPLLIDARATVVGLDGNPVSHPFKKTFNYGEGGITIPSNKEVVAVEKKNGFFLQLFQNPYSKEVVFTSSGQFDSPFVKLGKKVIYKTGIYGNIVKYFNQSFQHLGNTTLLFEILTPEDPHPIPCNEEAAYLIGIGFDNGYFLGEQSLDLINQQEIKAQRPNWYRAEFGQVLRDINACYHEGYMVRDGDSQQHLLKLKSPFYKTVKYFCRLSEGRQKLMFQNFQNFCEGRGKVVENVALDIVIHSSFEKWNPSSFEEKRSFVIKALKRWAWDENGEFKLNSVTSEVLNRLFL